MEHTANLALPYIMPSQAQKHVTHNEALRMLDAQVQLSVASRLLTAPPATPSEGERHIVAEGATSIWEGWDNDIAAYADGAWMRLSPLTGWLAWVDDERRLVIFTDGGWDEPGAASAARFDGIGVRTDADTTNRLAVKSDGVFFCCDDQTPGTGDMRVTLNRSADARDAGFVFQTDWSSRALFGLLGDDRFTIKVSPDGDAFHEAVAIDSGSGDITFGAPYLSLDDAAVRSHRPLLPASDNALSLGSATQRWSVVHAATGTISTSDTRMKENVKAVPAGLDFVRDLLPVSYTLKGGTRTHFGLIAQDVWAAMKKHDIADFAGWTLADPADPASQQGLRYEQFIAVLVRAVQELASEVDAIRETTAGG